LQPGRISVMERERYEGPSQTADGAVVESDAYRQRAESPTERLDVEADVETEGRGRVRRIGRCRQPYLAPCGP
jgi:hypothetical protein